MGTDVRGQAVSVPWRRPSYDAQAILSRLTRIEESLARLEMGSKRVAKMEKMQKAMAKLLDQQADAIMELRAKS